MLALSYDKKSRLPTQTGEPGTLALHMPTLAALLASAAVLRCKAMMQLNSYLSRPR
jgi:hypothetical protein